MTTTQYAIDGFGTPIFASTKQVKQIVNGSITPGSVVVGDLSPSLPVKTDGNKKLVSGLISQGDLDFTPSVYSGTLPAPVGNLLKIADVNGNNEESNITETDITTLQTDVSNLQNDKLNIDGSSIMTGNLSLGGNSIQNVNNVETESIGNTAGTFDINLADAVFSINRPSGGNTILSLTELGNNPFNLRKSGVVNDICSEGSDELHLTTDCFGAIKKVIISPNNDKVLLRDYSLDMNSNDITNIRSMTATATQYISRVEDLGSPVGDYYVIPDNTTWIILGQITLEYGIQYGVNCSLRGIDFSAQITFDETSRDCDIKATDNNFYLSQLTLVGGGGRFTGVPASVRGLLNAQNYNVGAPPPFYGRNKRFKVTDCNILRPFKIGSVEGFGTLNVTNNFFNGGGGLAGQPTSYYTNEGLSVSDGLSLELNNNKMVLMLGAQQASSLKLLNMKARVSPLLSFNAVTITGNIFHPRSTETGIDFDTDSRTQLGNISGNVFIRSGGSAPLINYTDQPTYDNYNPLSIENYSINANTGVTDSEPNLKCGVNDSQSISSATATLLEPFDNADVKAINVSARFGIQLDLTGVSSAFVINERITDTASGNTALILAVDAESGGNQSVYITDMSGDFGAIPTAFTSATGNATAGNLRWIFRYSEKDPRKLVLTATFSVSVGSNKEYFISPSMNGMADTICESGGISTNTGAGSTLTIVCSKKYSEGDKEQFYFRTADASAGNVTKGIIIIK